MDDDDHTHEHDCTGGDDLDALDAAGPLPPSFLGRAVPAWGQIRTVTIEAGDQRPYDGAEWLDAIVLVDQGRITLVGVCGSCTWFEAGDLLWLEDLPLRVIRNDGLEPAVLIAVSRRGSDP